jgi:hypothetical protein
MNHHSSIDSSNSSVVSADAISRRAYELWEQEGRPEGNDMRHWFQAERELSSTSSDSSVRTMSGTTQTTNTGSDVRPLQGTRAAAAANRESKRGSNAPFGGEKNGQASRRKSPQSPVL